MEQTEKKFDAVVEMVEVMQKQHCDLCYAVMMNYDCDVRDEKEEKESGF